VLKTGLGFGVGLSFSHPAGDPEVEQVEADDEELAVVGSNAQRRVAILDNDGDIQRVLIG
jgi:hypothetical protein